ncbi:MAG: NAD(P)-dependent alcohol dehydrogenase [Myxococcales bacterium]|nr:NAD(P)-dependent alcohol dehydrogenase [Myxococcales bacterium]
MKAIVYRRFGPPDVLELADVAEPRLRRGEALVRVEAAALNPKDVLVRKGRMRWAGALTLPRTPGYDFAGQIERLHPSVQSSAGVAVGDEVFGMVQAMRGGTCAELVAVPTDELAPRPRGLSAERAAALPLVALTALQALRDLGELRAGQRLLVNGASGGVGTVALQIARARGAQITAVCSAANAAMVRALGADEVIDYNEQDPTSGERRYHVFFDTFGNRRYADARRVLLDEGRYVTTVPNARSLRQEVLGRLGLSRARLVVVRSRRRDLENIATLVEVGVLEPVIDRVLPLEKSAEAHAHLETRRARGKVVLTVG